MTEMHLHLLDGIRELNTLYNDGIIVQDFATDTDESVHKSNIAAGKVALIEYVYRLTSCKPEEFDSLEAQLMSDMENAGLNDVIEGRVALYDEEMADAE